MRPHDTKRAQREELARLQAEFLANGGKSQEIPKGVSGAKEALFNNRNPDGKETASQQFARVNAKRKAK